MDRSIAVGELSMCLHAKILAKYRGLDNYYDCVTCLYLALLASKNSDIELVLRGVAWSHM